MFTIGKLIYWFGTWSASVIFALRPFRSSFINSPLLHPQIPIVSLDPSPFVSPSPDSYSAAGSEGSISTSVVSLPPQASGSSAPSSPGSRRSVSTLKKWLTNPVRKLSAGATAKGERQVRKLEGKPPPLSSHSHSQDLGSPPRTDDMLTILPVTHRELVRKN